MSHKDHDTRETHKSRSNTKLVTGGKAFVETTPDTRDGRYLVKRGDIYDLYTQERGVQMLERSFDSLEDAQEYLNNE